METAISEEDSLRRKPYPKLMINTRYDTLVLFSKYGVGSVIHSPCVNTPQGFYSSDWVMRPFIDYETPVSDFALSPSYSKKV